MSDEWNEIMLRVKGCCHQQDKYNCLASQHSGKPRCLNKAVVSTYTYPEPVPKKGLDAHAVK